MLMYSWFHIGVRMKTRAVLCCFIVLYGATVTFYACLYLLFGMWKPDVDACYNFSSCMFFSLITHGTVGMGVRDPKFNNCIYMLVILTTQCVVALVSDAVLISMVMARWTRGETRAATLVFSDTALITQHKGENYLLFQVYDEKCPSIVEASVRVFCYVHHKNQNDERSFPYCRALKLLNPNPDDGSIIMLFSPTVVVHKIDSDSPLFSAIQMMGFTPHGLSPKSLWRLLDRLPHFEIVVEVNASEPFTAAQIQARWSYVCGEIEVNEPTSTFQTPVVHVKEGLAAVNPTSVRDWRNLGNTSESSTNTHNQLARALTFILSSS